jgi:acyl carrier protein phosphodiesterase
LNYLAHAILSFNDTGVLTGNLISDFVKGKKRYDYPQAVQRGITLHRFIDTFTDEHTQTKEARKIFQPAYRLYSGAFIDVVFDHFLAKQLASETDLKAVTTGFYAQLDENVSLFPSPFDSMFPHMKTHDWLYNYQFDWGIERSFNGLRRRAQHIAEVDTAFDIFKEHYSDLENHFNHFWPELREFALAEFNKG